MKTSPVTRLPIGWLPNIPFLTLSAAILLFQAGMASAAIVYTSAYEADHLPETAGGDTANPTWSLGSTTDKASANGGFLTSSTATVAALQWWAIGKSSGTTDYAGSTTGVWDTSTATIDFRLQVTAAIGGGGTATSPDRGGFMIQISDQNTKNFFSFYIGTTGFTYTTISGAGGKGLNVDGYDNSSDFKEYRITLQNNKASLYVAGNPTPIFDQVPGISLGANTRNAVIFGDASSSISGSYTLDYIRLSNTTAEFSAPIPEPETGALMSSLLGGWLLFLMGRRWKSGC